MGFVDQMKVQYQLNEEISLQMRKAIKLNRDKKSMRYQSLISEFPHRLQRAIARQMHSKIYCCVDYFRGREISFINWVGLLLVQNNFFEQEYIT